MSKNKTNNINFYAAYREGHREKKSPARWLRGLIPLLIILGIIIAVTMFIRLSNFKTSNEVDAMTRQIQLLAPQYEDTKALSERSATLLALADELQADADLAESLPQLNENLFVQVNACAAETFNISVFRYNEETRTLEIDASAPSVNDVPALVEALRDTKLFSTIEYSGYTSDTDGVYYCTVGCVLAG
jgi:Zn-dependent M28 family amino/carboxypeptidase